MERRGFLKGLLGVGVGSVALQRPTELTSPQAGPVERVPIEKTPVASDRYNGVQTASFCWTTELGLEVPWMQRK